MVELLYVGAAGAALLLTIAAVLAVRGRRRRAGVGGTDLETSPVGSAAFPRSRVHSRPVAEQVGPPAARVVTPDAVDEQALVAEAAGETAGAPATLTAPPAWSEEDTAAELARLWSRRDVEGLAALGAAHPGAAPAALTLAGTAAASVGDPRADAWLMGAFTTGVELENDPLLLPFIDEVSVEYVVPDLHLRMTLPVSRVALGLRLAEAELALHDPESAYGLLLELPDSELVAAAEAHAALELHWPARAVAAARRALDGGTDPSAHTFLAAARAFAAGDEHDQARHCAASALARASERGDVALEHAAMFELADAHRRTGDTDAAWALLAPLAALDPPYPGAATALKLL